MSLSRRASPKTSRWFIGIRDYHLLVNEGQLSDPVWRDEATLPSLCIDTINRAALLPLLRSFWFAFGVRRPDNPFNE